MSDRFVVNSSSTDGKLALKSDQLKKVLRNCSTAALSRSGDDRHGRRVDEVPLVAGR
jgi:hypothetical protein